MDLPLNEELNKLSACIHCGMCLPACPTYRVTGSEAESPRGRLYLMNAFLENRLTDPKQLTRHLDPCLGCQGCVTACPSGVEYGTILTAAREQLVSTQSPIKRTIRRFFLKQVLPRQGLLNLMAQWIRLYQQTGLQKTVRRLNLLQKLGPLGAPEQFMPTVQPEKPLTAGQTFGTNRRGRVALLTGCIMNAAYAGVHQATITVLTANGYEVFIPQQTCCGALAHHAGETDIARDLAQQNIQAVLVEKPDWIVANAAGCGSTLKEYGHLLPEDELANRFSGRVVDVLELLAQQPLEGNLSPVPMTVTYHAACHLHHAQRVQQQPYTLLRQVPGLNLVPLTDAELCCGSAGVYNIAHPELSKQILAEKTAALQQTGAETVLAANPGCILQLEAGIRQTGLNMTVMHPIELLAKAYSETSTRPALRLV